MRRVRLTIYQYPNCSTCKRALAWLDKHGHAYTSIDLVEKPPSKRELERIHTLAGVPLKKLFNVSGQSYRNGKFGDRLPTMTEAQQFAALAADGKLIKRPILVGGEKVALVGFDEAAWRAALAT